MSMNTGNFFKATRDVAVGMSPEGPEGAGTLLTEDKGEPSTDTAPPTQSPSGIEKDFTVTPAPSTNYGAKVQSPASLQGNVIATCDGSK